MNQNTDDFVKKKINIYNDISDDIKKSLIYIMETGFLPSDASSPDIKSQTDSYLFFYVLSGKGVVEYGQESIKASKGQCVFMDCRIPHRYYANPSDPWEVLWIGFNGVSAEYYYNIFSQDKCCVFIPGDSENIKIVMNKILKNNLHKNQDTDIFNAKLLTDLMTSVITGYCIYEDEYNNSFHNKLMSVKTYLDMNFASPINLDHLAEKFYISKFYLAREFKKEYGQTIIQYTLNKRMEYAKELLRFSDKSIEEISDICGFNDHSYFSRQFKKSENITCRAYRKQYQKE